MIRILSATTLAVAALAIPAAGLAAAPGYVPGQMIVGFDPGTSAAERAGVRAAAGATGHAPISPLARDTELLRIRARDVPRAAVALERNAHVRFAEPDWLLSAAEVSNDTLVIGGSTWGLYGATSSPANAFGVDALGAWGAGRVGSRDVAVGIIDTGVDISHPDLAANMWRNPGEVADDGIDNDANGYIDDVRGWDFHNNDKTVYDASDGDSHGTHVAGTIGAEGGNAVGVAGVNWNVTMIPAKFLGPNGGYTSNAIKAVDYLTGLKAKHGLNLVASNNSWGGGGYSQSLLDAINRAGNAGILFVAAAGNGGSDGVGDNNDTGAYYPTNYQCTTATRAWDCVVSVAAITSTGARASFSNYGATTVDLGAPGASIMSTLPGNTYNRYSGTSMATPHVTGALALCRASYPALGASRTRSTLLSTTTATSSLSGITVSAGRANAAAMAASCATQKTADATPDPEPDPTPPPPTPAPPAAFGKSSPVNGATGINAKAAQLKWQASAGALSYAVCIDSVNNNACDGSFVSVGNVLASTQKLVAKRTYYWQVQAINADGTTVANAGTWWRLTTK